MLLLQRKQITFLFLTLHKLTLQINLQKSVELTAARSCASLVCGRSRTLPGWRSVQRRLWSTARTERQQTVGLCRPSQRETSEQSNERPQSVSIHRVTPGKPATASCDHGNSAIIRQSPITANPLHIRLQNWNLGTRPEVVVIVSKIFLHFMKMLLFFP